MQIVCVKCGTTLRKTAGLHRAGEPPLALDERGRVIRCPTCGGEYRPSQEDAGTAPSRSSKDSGSKR